MYHFYYGDERGTPGTIWTTFPYTDRGVPAGVTGAGQVTVTSFSVPAGSLDVWRARLGARGIACTDVASRFGDPVLRFADRSGLTFELIANASDERTPWIADRSITVRLKPDTTGLTTAFNRRERKERRGCRALLPRT